jgi:alkylation response protein AidB-like acyl-CoA dehydrogenase
MTTASLSIERRNILDTVRAFARKEVAPRVREYDQAETVPRDLLERMAELGFYGGTIPERYGGLGLDHETYAMAIEEMSTVCHMMGLFMSMASGLVGSGILRYGTEDQIERFLTPLARGELFGGAGVTEPHSGTDVAAMETTVERSNGAYILRGQKIFTSNLDIGDFFVTFGTLDPKTPRKGICAFIIPKDTPGLTVRPFKGKLGFRPIATGELLLDDCRVPAENRLGEEGEGLRVAMCAVENGRLSVAARSVGIARGCLEASRAYASERIVFNQPIARFQLVQSKITDMLVGVETAHLLLRRAGQALDEGQPARKLVSMAKMYASDVAMRSATDAMQIHGAYGVLDDYPVARYFRDAKVMQIVEGTNDLHRSMIAELEFGYRPER